MTGIRNCHIPGLHSIVLSAYPDGRPHRRMFVATPEHTLWRNDNVDGRYSVAIHRHGSALRLTQLVGPVYQVRARVSRHGLPHIAWRFDSVIRNGEGGFVCQNLSFDILVCAPVPMEITRMVASDLHTVYVPKGHRAAWLVEEGKTRSDDAGLCYSNTELATWNSDGLYEGMNDDECREMLRSVWAMQ